MTPTMIMWRDENISYRAWLRVMHSHQGGHGDSRPRRIVLFAVLLGVFASTEFGVGLYVNSLALLTDSIHLLSDVVAMVVGLQAIRYARQPPDATFTYGLGRYEILGGLANACFLLAVCLFIIIEALQRFISIGELQETQLIVYVGCVGFVLNGFGLLLFGAVAVLLCHTSEPCRLTLYSHTGGHAHGHGHGHGHGHEHEHEDEQGHSHLSKHGHHHTHDQAERGQLQLQSDAVQEWEQSVQEHSQALAEGDMDSHDNGDSDGEGEDDHAHLASSRAPRRNVNMQAIFLHVMSDFMGSIGVIVSGALETYLTWPYRFYIDPATSLLIAVIIAFSAVPILRSTARLLLQSAPDEVSLAMLRRKLLQIGGVRQLGSVHVWQLTEGKLVGTAQVRVVEGVDRDVVLREAQNLFDRFSIYECAIQISLYGLPERIRRHQTGSAGHHHSHGHHHGSAATSATHKHNQPQVDSMYDDHDPDDIEDATELFDLADEYD